MSQLSRIVMAICALSTPVALAAQATVEGVVFDSVTRRPLAGASVQLMSTASTATARMLSATADSAGKFRIDDVPRGQYLAGFFHAAVDSLGLELPARAIDITSDRYRVQLAIPSPRGLASVFCPQEPLTDSTGMIIGHVRESGSERPLANARVHADWSVTAIERTSITSVRLNASSETTGPGWFAICGVPSAVPLLARAVHATDTTGYVQLEVATQGLVHLTLHVAHVEPSAAKAVLTGTVLDESGRPLVANVSAWQVAASTTTNGRGQFSLTGLPPGTRTIETRSIGRTPVLNVVHLVAGEVARLDVTLSRAVVLEKMETRAEVAYSKGLMAFEMHRRTAAGGYFIRPSEAAGVAGQDLVALVRAGPGIEVTFSPQDHRWHVYMRRPGVLITAGGSGSCTPQIYLDGVKTLLDFDDVVGFVGYDKILGLEIYTHFNEVPPDYQLASFTSCGLLSIWTRPAAAPFKRP
ncbi:MAG TPA: carboxypeptidase regulatory-like domain-containing protein [Gemmatimonadaceae bacterium]